MTTREETTIEEATRLAHELRDGVRTNTADAARFARLIELLDSLDEWERE